MSLFADLVPAAAPAASAAVIPFAQRGAHPIASTFRKPDGTIDMPAYQAAVHSWETVPRAAPTATPTPAAGAPAPGTPAAGTPAPAPGTPATPSALSAWDTFYNSPTYQVPLAAGLKAINTGYAAKGALESGAAMKAISDYGAGQASGALSTYMDDLYRQEALGESAAAATAGVGQNLVSQVSANNNNAADASGNAALIAGQASANGWNTAGSAIGTAAGSIAGALGSSYHPANAIAPYTPPVYNPASASGNFIYTGSGSLGGGYQY